MQSKQKLFSSFRQSAHVLPSSLTANVAFEPRTMSTRSASHAGTWYSSSARELNSQLEGWLSKVYASCRPAKAIIAPHAGYQYCGKCGAHAYKQIDPSKIKRIFILGPSHHMYLPGCAITTLAQYQTPLYNLTIDTKVNDELYATGEFEKLNQASDETEHSIELHLPYIAKVMESKKDQFTIVPILVGSLSYETEAKYGRLLSTYLIRPENFFVISSDFCHWGKRFNYTFWDKSYGPIYQSIEALDRKGMEAIEKLDPGGFAEYLKKYKNTICGRHPIGVLLNGTKKFRSDSPGLVDFVVGLVEFILHLPDRQAVEVMRQMNGVVHPWALEFIHYSQSNACNHPSDSSVSYAAGVLYQKAHTPDRVALGRENLKLNHSKS